MRRGEVVPRVDIVEEVCGLDSEATLRKVDNHVVALRRAIGDDPRRPRWIHTVRGSGYRLARADGRHAPDRRIARARILPARHPWRTPWRWKPMTNTMRFLPVLALAASLAAAPSGDVDQQIASGSCRPTWATGRQRPPHSSRPRGTRRRAPLQHWEALVRLGVARRALGDARGSVTAFER